MSGGVIGLRGLDVSVTQAVRLLRRRHGCVSDPTHTKDEEKQCELETAFTSRCGLRLIKIALKNSGSLMTLIPNYKH